MGISIETAHERLYKSYNVDVDKYTNDETVDEFGERLEGILSFSITVILPVIISGVMALAASVGLSLYLNSVVFGVLFFIFSIPVFLIGIGALGFAKATENLYEGVSFILAFTSNITNDIRSGILKEGKVSVDPKDITLLVLYGIVFPIVKKIIRNNIFGGVLYFIIEKIVNKGSKEISYDSIVQNDDSGSNSGKGSKLFNVTEKVKSISMVASKAIVSILKVIGIVFIFIGLILITILCLVYFVF